MLKKEKNSISKLIDPAMAQSALEEEKEAHEETRIRLESTIAERLVAKSKRG